MEATALFLAKTMGYQSATEARDDLELMGVDGEDGLLDLLRTKDGRSQPASSQVSVREGTSDSRDVVRDLQAQLDASR